MYFLHLLLVVIASIPFQVDSAMIVSSSSYYHEQITTIKEVFKNNSKTFRKFHLTPGEKIHNSLRDVAFRDPRAFGKCLLNGEAFSVGSYTLFGCRGLNCAPNGVVVINTCPKGLQIEGGICDEGAPVRPASDYPDCCERKYTCTINA